MPDRAAVTSPVIWNESGPPRSRLFGDLYYSQEDGFAEARTIFLAGCGLPEAWEGRRTFCVGELGFGTGLNIVALLDLWMRTRPAGGHLSIFSVEAYPVTVEDARRALAAWPELSRISDSLTTRWPGRARGFHRVDLPGFNATLDLAVMEVATALEAWTGKADAWFLDGFAPALNPEMWRPEVLDLVGRRSSPGARIATYTVAGQVRRDLAAAGFEVKRCPGFGAKRQRLEGARSGTPPRPTSAPAPRVAIIGAGIAGAALARAFRTLAINPLVFDKVGIGAGASGAAAALVSPRLDAGLGPHAALFAQAFIRACGLYAEVEKATIAKGALQLEAGPKDAARFAAIADSDLFEPRTMRPVSDGDVSGRLGEAAPPGLWIEGALTIQPSTVLDGWLGQVTPADIASIEWDNQEWVLRDPAGGSISRADIVCLAAAMGTTRLATGVPVTPVRGQASLARGVFWPAATLWGSYLIPTPTGLLFGATHDRGDESSMPRVDDHWRNLEALKRTFPDLGDRLANVPLEAHTGVRATTADYLPIAGQAPEAPPGLFVLAGLGSRGFTLAPLLAEHVAAWALCVASPLPASLIALVDPCRFAERARRRSGASGQELKTAGASPGTVTPAGAA
jgi:tRNA 5-methylaminomethyl-2-thiouridine biosynthesis bifunctional protein